VNGDRGRKGGAVVRVWVLRVRHHVTDELSSVKSTTTGVKWFYEARLVQCPSFSPSAFCLLAVNPSAV